MDYITIKEAAQKWNVSERCVQIYCKNKRIHGAKWIGKQWQIPSDAEKPLDGRIKKSSEAFDYEPYHFPILIYSRYFTERTELSRDELELLNAQLLTAQNEFAESFKICKNLIDSTSSTSVRLGAYATNVQNSIMLGLRTDMLHGISAIERLRDETPMHYEDYNLILSYFRYSGTFDTSEIRKIDICNLSMDALTAYELFELLVSVFDRSIETANAVRHFEILCKRFECFGMLPSALLSHGSIAHIYGNLGDNERMLYHANETVRIGCEQKYYTLLSRMSTLNLNGYLSIIKEYNSGVASIITKINRNNRRNWTANMMISGKQTPAAILSQLTPEESEYLLLVSNGLTNRMIAKVRGISAMQVGENISLLCTHLNCITRAELVKLADACFAPAHPNAKTREN